MERLRTVMRFEHLQIQAIRLLNYLSRKSTSPIALKVLIVLLSASLLRRRFYGGPGEAIYLTPLEQAEAVTATTMTTTTVPLVDVNRDLSGFRDMSIPYDSNSYQDVPVYLHLPKSGGTSMKDLIGRCHRKVLTTEVGLQDGHGMVDKIEVVDFGGYMKVINVDTTTDSGIQRAIDLGLFSNVDDVTADVDVVVFTHDIFRANSMFSSSRTSRKGRIFALFRHPIDRTVSLFHYLRYATWEPTYHPRFATMTLAEYAADPLAERNFLTRVLTHSLAGDIDETHLQRAKEVVSSRILVGLLSELDASLQLFERYFGWAYQANPEIQETCRETMLHFGLNSNTQGKEFDVVEGTELYTLLMEQNSYDMELYHYIEELFRDQQQKSGGVYDEGADKDQAFRFVGSTCSECAAVGQT